MAKESTVAVGESLTVQRWRLFKRHKLAVGSAVIIGVLAIVAIFAPVFALRDPYDIDLQNVKSPPSREHILGTDDAGRDVWSRLIYGTRVSLTVGIVAVGISVSIGTILGAISGYYGGGLDSLIMRITDVFMAFPSMLTVLLLVALLEPSVYNAVAAIGLMGWPSVCRLVRGQFLSLREQDFVLAARCVGMADRRIIFRHILPNGMGPVIVATTFGVAGAILLESALSFLGLGVQPPTASWGNMLHQARSTYILYRMPWLWAPPGLMIFVSVLAINLIGDGLHDSLDPWMANR